MLLCESCCKNTMNTSCCCAKYDSVLPDLTQALQSALAAENFQVRHDSGQVENGRLAVKIAFKKPPDRLSIQKVPFNK